MPPEQTRHVREPKSCEVRSLRGGQWLWRSMIFPIVVLGLVYSTRLVLSKSHARAHQIERGTMRKSVRRTFVYPDAIKSGESSTMHGDRSPEVKIAGINFISPPNTDLMYSPPPAAPPPRSRKDDQKSDTISPLDASVTFVHYRPWHPKQVGQVFGYISTNRKPIHSVSSSLGVQFNSLIAPPSAPAPRVGNPAIA